jgi:Tautomerase enzyme
MMLVQIALKAGRDARICRKIGDCIHRAIDAALVRSSEGIVRIVTEQVVDVAIQPQSAASARDFKVAAAVILLYPRSKHSDRTKRLLFGRIGEALESEFQISRRELVIGIVETPSRNWTFGHDEAELALAVEGQLP